MPLPAKPVRALAGAALAAVVTLAPLQAATAGAAGRTGSETAASGPAEAVTLVLAPPDAAALHSVADSRALSSATRSRDLAELTPSPAEHQQVEQAARDLGLKVTGENALEVKLSGPAGAVNAMFGSEPAGGPGEHGHLLSSLPPSLQGMVTAAYGGDATQRVGHPIDVVRGPRTVAATGSCALHAGVSPSVSGCGYDASQLRTLYSGGSPATPPVGTTDTIATIQLSGWDAQDLSTFAAADDTPLAARQYRAVSVDGANPAKSDGQGGDIEVALDQEMLLAMAPHADQLAFFAPNTQQGLADAIAEVFDYNTEQQPAAHIAALSQSWGGCEPDMFDGPTGEPDPALAAGFEELYAYVVASGTTVFAASGDNGSSDDCELATRAVDYPASDPSVVGVGGTSLLRGTAANPTVPTTPTLSDQTAWNDLAVHDGASGGGRSVIFPTPFYQSTLPNAPSMRAVPDISADADPNSGFDLYTTDTSLTGAPWGEIGGTSMAAPMEAALLTDQLLAAGYSEGIGDIHAALYAANATSSIFDVTAHGYWAGSGAKAPGPGYDEITGLGTPVWSNLDSGLTGAPFINVGTFYLNTTATSLPITMSWLGQGGGSDPYTAWSAAEVSHPPAIDGDQVSPPPDQAACTAQATNSSPPSMVTGLPSADGWYQVAVYSVSSSGTCYESVTTLFRDTVPPRVGSLAIGPAGGRHDLLVSWVGTDPGSTSEVPTGSGVARYAYTLSRSGRVVASGTTTRESAVVAGLPSTSYTLSVTATDNAGNTSTPATLTQTSPVNDELFTASSGWREQAHAGAYQYDTRVASGAGDWLSYSFTGKFARLYVTETAGSGRLHMYLDGKLVRNPSLYSRTTRYLVAFTLLARSSAVHERLRLVVAGNHVGASHGNQVSVDALEVH